MQSRSMILAVALCAALGLHARAADPTPGAVFINSSEIKWGAAPPVLPKGARFAVLSGDPGKEGAFVVRLQMPANYRIAPHWHSKDEDLTVISGSFHLAEGDKLETAHAHAITAGGYHHLPAKAHHFAYTTAPTVVQINGQGPFDITYIDPRNDPSKAATPAPKS
jgi:hypothetical protein